MLKLWIFLKFMFCVIVGCGLLAQITIMMFGADRLGSTAYVISIIVWMSYLWRYYYPVKKDDEIDFKDLK